MDEDLSVRERGLRMELSLIELERKRRRETKDAGINIVPNSNFYDQAGSGNLLEPFDI